MPLSLRDPRTQLLAVYAGLLVLSYAIHLLPGNPFFPTEGALAFSLAIDVVLFRYVARGSRAALAIALGLNLLFFASLVLFSVDWPDAGVAAFAIVKLAETVVLVTLWRLPREAAGSSPAV